MKPKEVVAKFVKISIAKYFPKSLNTAEAHLLFF